MSVDTSREEEEYILDCEENSNARKAKNRALQSGYGEPRLFMRVCRRVVEDKK